MTFSFKTFVKDFFWVIKYMLSIMTYGIVIILILAGVLLGVYYVDRQITMKRGEEKPPLYGAYVIITTSMTPVINQNDAIIVKRVTKDNLEVGDVVTYKSEEPSYYGILITHRIIEIYEENGIKKYLTKGDYNETPDPHGINFNQIYGKVVMRIPKIGYVQSFLSTFIGWVIAILIPCCYVVISSIMNLVSKMKESRHERRLRRRKVILSEEY